MSGVVTDPVARGQCMMVGPRPTSPQGDAFDAPASIPELDVVYRDHVDFVYRVACQLRVSPAHVEDVVHDVFLVVHRRLAQYDGRSMRAWLYGIARRVVLHHQRGLQRRTRRLQNVLPPQAPVAPDDAVAKAHAIDLVERFIATLDEAQRAVFVLAEIEGTPIPEIAASFGVNLNTVYSRLRLARRRFATFVAEQHPSASEGLRG